MAVKTSDYKQDNLAVWPHRITIDEHSNADGRDSLHMIHTKYGFVFGRSYQYDAHGESTFLSFIWRGREYNRRWWRCWGNKTITRLARQMAEEIASGAS